MFSDYENKFIKGKVIRTAVTPTNVDIEQIRVEMKLCKIILPKKKK